MKHAFAIALIATGLSTTAAPCATATNKVPGGTKADDCVSDMVTSVDFFRKHENQRDPFDISDVKRKCEKQTKAKVKVFKSNLFQYDFD